MNCVELRESLIEVDDGRSVEQRAHLKTCQECSALVADLKSVAHWAVELRAADEPDPRVWKAIESALRREGLIRPQRSASRSLLPSFGSSWGSRAGWSSRGRTSDRCRPLRSSAFIAAHRRKQSSRACRL